MSNRLPVSKRDELLAANDVAALTEKVVPVAADLLVIEDSADSNNKKRVQIGNLPSGGGGLSIVETSFTTASIAGGGFNEETGNLTGLSSDNILIVGAELTMTAGTASTVTVLLYQTDTHTTAQGALFGDQFSGAADISAGTLYGPLPTPGGSGILGASPYHDYDGTQELHWKVINTDFGGSDSGTFRVRLKYVDLGATYTG